MQGATADDDTKFQEWYAAIAPRLGLGAAPDAAQDGFDWRAAYAAGSAGAQAPAMSIAEHAETYGTGGGKRMAGGRPVYGALTAR